VPAAAGGAHAMSLAVSSLRALEICSKLTCLIDYRVFAMAVENADTSHAKIAERKRLTR
jgi:hypothetical protein